MSIDNFKHKNLYLKGSEVCVSKASKMSFFKDDSCLSNCQVVFTTKPNYTTTPFNQETFFIFGEGFNE